MRISLLPSSVTQSKTLRMLIEKTRSAMFIVKMSTAVMYTVILLAFIISFLFTGTISLTYWLNTVFILSMIVLLVGCSMLVIQGGFFDRFIANFKYFWRKNDRAEEMVREVEGRRSDNTSTHTKTGNVHIVTKVMMVSGGFLVLLSIILSYAL